jgi:anthranilate synthase component I
LRSQARVVAAARIECGATDAAIEAAYAAALRTVDATIKRLRGPSVLQPLMLDPEARPAQGESRYEKSKFMADVERVREYIIAGDAFQVQIARRIDVPFDFSSTDLYRALRVINPSPYMYHLILDGVEIVGSSPELLVRVSAGGTVTLRPIAGTRRRGRNAAEDQQMTDELIADEKERAEHLMLVDLGRNDVGRIAKYGSVRVSELMVVERYSHVLHLVSQVDGELRDGLTAMDAFRAGFPAGTLTGAPKVRAMQIIDEMEPERRGPYGGAVGYLSAGVKRMDLAITIRTCVIANGVASVQSAAGVVYDSVPEREFLEHQNKARALLTAIGQIRPSRR